MMTNKYLSSGKAAIILLLVIVLTATAYAGLPLLRTWWDREPVSVAAEKQRYGKREAGILMELLAVYSRMDTLSTLELGGEMKVTDPSDPVNDVNTDFTYCKKGSLLYYRMGESEMIQLADINISTNKIANKLFITPPKKIITAPHLPVDSIIALWEDDRYAITATETDGLVKVTFLCELHVTCKELQITYNRISHKLNNVYMRLTNLSDPLDAKLDRRVNVRFNNWEETVATDKYFKLSSYIAKRQTHWEPAGIYRGYQIISTL